jgi:hypothetical protein
MDWESIFNAFGAGYVAVKAGHSFVISKEGEGWLLSYRPLDRFAPVAFRQDVEHSPLYPTETAARAAAAKVAREAVQ